MRSSIILALLFFALNSFAAQTQLSSKSIWNPKIGETDLLQRIRDVCSRDLELGHIKTIHSCFIAELEKLKVDPEVVQFVKQTKTIGYMTDFKRVGPVDLAYVNFSFRANQNEGFYLANGTPSLIDVDDPKWVDSAKTHSFFLVLQKKYPNLSIFPGDRSPSFVPQIIRKPRGEIDFVFQYSLRDGCRACAHLGQLDLSFRFNSKGKFQGVIVHQVKASHEKSE